VEPSDEALCRRVAQHDEAAFDLLVTRYQQRAWRLAWSILRDTEDARDISQEAFARLYHAAGRFDGRARFSTWFYRILVNLCLDHRRRHRWWRWLFAGDGGSAGEGPEASLLERVAAESADPAAALDLERASKRLWAAVEELPPRQRATVLLYAHDALPTKEIAGVLGCSETTVRVHLHRALITLKRRLGGTDGASDAGADR
jgi:RNA polymerase sigma-70 factor (ECF subfamily)